MRSHSLPLRIYATLAAN
jgi:hypothetical protein